MKAVLRRAIALIVAVVAVTPLLWLGLSAFKKRVDLLDWSPQLLFSPTTDNFVMAFGQDSFGAHAWNSFIIATASAAIAVSLALPAAFALSRCRVRGKDTLLFLALSTRMALPAALALPLFVVFRTIGLLDTVTGVVLAHTGVNLAFAIWMLKGFFDELPSSFSDAAAIDGLGLKTVLWLAIRGVLPGIGVVAAFCFLFSWNDFFLAMVLSSRAATTLPVGILGLVTPAGTQWGEVAAVGTAAVIPVIVLIVVGRGLLIRALTLGAVRGRV